jgi:cytochrome c biogenesis protein CcmG/thiol:disulfide interchange protein DsbE
MGQIRWLTNEWHWNGFILGLTFIGGLWIWMSRLPASASTNSGLPPSPREGFSAPDFSLDQLGGGQIELSDLRGKVVMINFWASWCPPCRAEMPAIEKVYRTYKALGLEVLAVNATNQDSESSASAFIAEFDLTFPVLLDRTGSVSATYNLHGLPSTYFVDRKGVIRSVVVGGPMSEALIQSRVEELLKGK